MPSLDPVTNPLRAIREMAGLSQRELARRLGVTPGAVANAEQRDPTVGHVRRVAEACGFSAEISVRKNRTKKRSTP